MTQDTDLRSSARLTRRRLLRLGALAGVGLAAVPLLSACGGSSAPPQVSSTSATASSPIATSATTASTSASSSAASSAAAARKQLAIAISGDNSSFDPPQWNAQADVAVMFNLYDNLLTRRADLKLYPLLATEWNLVNPSLWQFKLRKDVKFHNGGPFTAKDVKFSIERTFKTKSQTIFATVDHVETPDDYTVNFVLKKTDPLLPARLAVSAGQIVPMDYATKVGEEAFALKPMGTGPIKFVEWVKGDRTLFTRNDDYWGDKIPFESVVFKPIPETATRLAAFAKGEIDICTRVPPDQVAEVNKTGKGPAVAVPYQGLYTLGVNTERPGLDNKMVRQAMSLAIDRQSLVKDIYQGQGTMANGPIVEGSLGYDPSLPPLPYDAKKAKEVLAQSGYKNEPIILEQTTLLASEKQLGEAIVGMWQDIGLNAKLEFMELSIRGQHYRDRTFKGLWFADPADMTLDPDGMMWRLLAPGGIMGYLRNAEFDKLGDEARFSTDNKLREANYRRMSKLLLEENNWITLMRPNEIYGVSNAIDWKPYGIGIIELRGFNLKLK